MLHFHPGQRIRCRGEEWQVLRAAVHKIANGGSIWEVEARGLTNIVAGQQYIFMSDLDEIEVVDPTDIEPQTDVSGCIFHAAETNCF